MSSHSLSNRLLITVSLLLALFFGVTCIVLDSVFRDSSEQAIRERLEIQVLVLMAASEEQGRNRLMPENSLLDARYLNPNSGLYGQITTAQGTAFWHSPSLLDLQLPVMNAVKPGVRKFGLQTLFNGTQVLTLGVGVSWEFANRHSQALVFTVAESMEQYYTQLRRFRVRLFGGFAAMSLLLVAALWLLFRKVLTPLRRIEREIEAVEAGQRTELSTNYPRELLGVTANLNALLHSERERMSRYRNTLGNLAHSLKTPLAVMRNVLSVNELRDLPASRQLDEQVGRMDDIVRYQLKRAAASAGMNLGSAPVPVHTVIQPLLSSLQKVYFERRIDCRTEFASDCVFIGDQNDLMELSGNLLDNAFKYCREQVRVSARILPSSGSRRPGLVLVVEDDGPGIAPAERQHVLARGTRLDERADGQGIGLSVVRELAELYGGEVSIAESDLGGARITVTLPGV